MPPPILQVVDKASGERRAIAADVYQADPGAYELVAGQAVVGPETGGAVQTLEVTPELAGAGVLGPSIAGEERAALTGEALQAELVGGTGEAVRQFAGGAVSGATFGLSDVIGGVPADPFEAEIESMARAEHADVRGAGQLVGAIAPALLSGGAGTLGTVARLSPAGRLSALTGRMAARGGVTRAVAGGALEGIAQAGGDYMSRVSLDEDAAFSGEALASALLAGGALGGIGGAAGRGLERVAGAGARRLSARADDALGRVLPQEGVGIAPLLAKKKPAKWSSYRSVVRRKLRDADAPAARALGESLESAATRATAREIDDALLSPGWQAMRVADEAGATALEVATRTAAADFDEAAAAARSWWSRYSDAVDLPAAKERIVRKAGKELDDEGAAVIARLDEARYQLDDHVAELSARAGVPIAGRAPAGEAASAASKTLRERAGGFLGGVRKPVEAVLGAGELARDVGLDVGIPTARDIPVVGQVMAAYLRYKGGKAALGKMGVKIGPTFPRSRAAAAAERVVSAETSIQSKVQRLAGGALRAVSVSAIPRVTTKVAAQQVREILAADAAAESAHVHQQLSDTTSATQVAAAAAAERALGYLAEHAPRDPMPSRLPGQPEWEPTPAQARAWERRLSATLDASRALDAVLTTSGAAIELQALRAVHPEHWRMARSDLAERMPELARTLPPAHLHGLGRAFDLPTSAAQYPGYGRATAAAMTPAPQQPRPSPGVSRAASLEEVA